MNFIDMIKILRGNNLARGVLGYNELIASEWGKNIYQINGRFSDTDTRYYEFPSLTAYQILSDEWEVKYPVNEVPKFKLHTFEEAIAALKDNKTIKRECWITKEIDRDFCDDYSIAFTIDDFEANDWIIVGE